MPILPLQLFLLDFLLILDIKLDFFLSRIDILYSLPFSVNVLRCLFTCSTFSVSSSWASAECILFQAQSAWLTDSSSPIYWSICSHTKWYWFLQTYSSSWLSFSFRFSMLILRLWSSLGTLNMLVTLLLTSLIDISLQIIAAPYNTLCNNLSYDTSIYVQM